MALSLGTIIVFLVFVLARHGANRSREIGYTFAKTAERAHVVETLNTIFTIKANAVEASRYAGWAALYATAMAERDKFSTGTLSTQCARNALLGLNLALFALLATQHVETTGVGLGSIFAALVYNTSFVNRALVLVERFREYRLLDVKLEGLEDIALAEPEEARLLPPGASEAQLSAGTPHQSATASQGFGVSAQGVSFRYGHASEWILRDLNVVVSPGEMVAIVGHNGCGKTTVVKLLMGLYLPSEGRLRIDDKWSDERGFHLLRTQVGIVTQDDQLLRGTVAENIASFDLEIDQRRVAIAAESACLQLDIERMPMGYQTRVGDIGSPISEGQKQKIFLARAFYKQPRLLILDEGTSNIDTESEARILRNLSAMPGTKILIAHRAAAFRGASRVLELRHGKFVELRNEVAPVGGLASSPSQAQVSVSEA